MSIIAVFPLQDVLDEGKNGIGVVHRDCLLAHRRHLRCLLALHHAFFSKIRLGSIPLRWSVARLTELKTRYLPASINADSPTSCLWFPFPASLCVRTPTSLPGGFFWLSELSSSPFWLGSQTQIGARRSNDAIPAVDIAPRRRMGTLANQ